MSRIDDLIAERCSAGVRHVALSEVAEYSPTRVDAANLDGTSFIGVDNLVADKGGRIDASYLPNTTRLTAYEPGDILLGNIRPYLKKVWRATNSGGCSGDVLAIRIKPAIQQSLTPEFLYYLLSSDDFFAYNMQHAKGAKMPRGNKAAILNYVVPVPPLEVQRAIVEVLDTFSKLEAELEAELEARKQQYEHYKSGAFELSSETTQVPLGELVDLLQGFAFKSSMYVESGIRIVRISDVQKGAMSNKDLKYYPESAEDEIARYKLNTGDLVMSLSGSVGRVAMLAESDLPAVLNQRVACIRPNTPRVITRYLFHYLNTNHFEQEAIASTSGGTVKNLSSRWLKEVLIPLPTIEAQERIVSILDKFDALVNDLSVGLPAELAARRQQYEYYRDKLLTFKDLEAVA